MAREISPVWGFFFGFICMNTVDIELTIRMVMGIYTYHKDHTVESTTFTLWSKSMIPLPSLRRKIQAFKDNNRWQMTLKWNNGMTP